MLKNLITSIIKTIQSKFFSPKLVINSSKEEIDSALAKTSIKTYAKIGLTERTEFLERNRQRLLAEAKSQPTILSKNKK